MRAQHLHSDAQTHSRMLPFRASSACRFAVRHAHAASAPLLAALRAAARPLPVRGADVDVISSPDDFAEVLHAGFRNARRRVVLASLYWGVEELHEKALLSSLAAAAAERPELQVTVLLDALRGTRPVPDGRGGVTSSAEALAAALLAGGARNARVALLHAPALRGPLARAARALPPRAREVAGVCHVKAFVCDDDALWTGANLAETYLTKRQDRYINFRSAPALADATSALVHAIAAQSYTLRPDGTLDGAAVASRPRTARAALASALGAVVAPLPGGGEAAAAAAVDATCADADTWVHLTAQAGFAGLRHDERVFEALLAACPPGSAAALATPYCNLPPATERALAATAAQPLAVLTAAPEAHGFAGARGVAAFVPAAYGVMEHRLVARLSARREGVSLREFNRPGWQFHAKGLWLWPPGGAAAEGPVATVVGSSNYGVRSAVRDVEAQLAVVTTHPGLRAALQREWEQLAAHAPPVALPQLAARKHGVGARLAAHAARRWM